MAMKRKDRRQVPFTAMANPKVAVVQAGSVALDLERSEAILVAEIDIARIVKGKFDLDVVGHYSRPDIFQLHVDERPKSSVTTHVTS
jgi:hypothetical protein